MKRNLLAISLSVMLVVVLMFVVAPSVKAEESNVIIAEANGEYSITESGKILDLNGQKNVAVNITAGITLSVVDSANTEMDGSLAGSLTKIGEGMIAPVSFDGDSRYLAVEENGTYSFHPFYLSITAIGLNTIGEDICLRVSFGANDVAKAKITDYGIEKLTGTTTGEVSAKAHYSFGNKNGIHTYYDLDGSLDADKLDTTNKFCAYMVIGGEKVVSNYAPEITPRQILKKINQEGLTPSDTQKVAIENLIAKSTYLKNLFTSISGAACEHQGGTATCTAQAVCIDCDVSYGDMLKHSYTTYVSTKKAAEGGVLGYDTYKCNTCDATEKVNWTRHILDKELVEKEINALAALTRESWPGNKANLNGAGPWFYKLAQVDVTSVLSGSINTVKIDLFTVTSESNLALKAGNTSDYAKMLVEGYWGSREGAYKHAQFKDTDFQIGDLFCAKGICKGCNKNYYMTALYQGNGKFLSIVNCGGGAGCVLDCDYDTTTAFAEDFFAQTDMATWDYYYVLRPDQLLTVEIPTIRDITTGELTPEEEAALAALDKADWNNKGNLNGAGVWMYEAAGIDLSAYLDKSVAGTYGQMFVSTLNETYNKKYYTLTEVTDANKKYHTMLVDKSWGGTWFAPDDQNLANVEFQVGDIFAGQFKDTANTYWTALYQGDGKFLVQQNVSGGTGSCMEKTYEDLAAIAWQVYFVIRPDQLASAK